jgi:hypothetical protein
MKEKFANVRVLYMYITIEKNIKTLSVAEDTVYYELKHLLKGPKCEIFDSGFFAPIRPKSIGDIGTRPKNYKF